MAVHPTTNKLKVVIEVHSYRKIQATQLYKRS